METPWRRILNLLLLALCLAAMSGIALQTRQPAPIDETRYVSVAWEMWTRGDLLVPYLNGAPYEHKPPLLFWLYQTGWALFGVNDLWPRLVSPLCTFACLGLLSATATQLRPGQPAIACSASRILAATLLWQIFTLATTFDLPLSV